MSCQRCCVVWLRFRDGQVQRGCPHCWRVISKHDELDEELARRQVDASIRIHMVVCPVPVRWAAPAKQTTVEQARQRSVEERLRRLRAARKG